MRCDNNNHLQDSSPCQNCLTTIIDLNIKRIVFSYKDSTFISCKPKELTIKHISAGNNYLRKNVKNVKNVENEKNENENIKNENIKNENIKNENEKNVNKKCRKCK